MAEGTTLTRSLEGIRRMIERPQDALRWIREKSRKGGSPLESALPWTSWKAIDHLARLDLRDKLVYEYGGGGSTIFFAQKGARVITIETHAPWTERILAQADTLGVRERISITTIEVVDADTKAQYLDHIRTVGGWDVALVDGYDTDVRADFKFPLRRMDCIPGVMATVRPGCLVVVDDAWRRTYTRAPQLLAPGKRRILRGLGPHRPGVTQTDIYIF